MISAVAYAVALLALVAMVPCLLYLLAYFAVDFACIVQAYRERGRMAERPWRR